MGLYFGNSSIPNVYVGFTSTEGIKLQDKAVTPTRDMQIVTCDESYDGLSKVTVGGIPDSYLDESQVTLQKKNATPTKGEQTIEPDDNYYGLSSVVVDAIPPQYVVTDDATASESDIISGKTAYVNGAKVVGTLIVNNYYTGSTAPSSSIGKDGDIYLQE